MLILSASDSVTDRNTYGRYFKLSGFTEEEIHDIACRTKEIKKVLKQQKERRQAEKQILKKYNGSNATLDAIIKARFALLHGQKKTKLQKVAEQIQYGWDLPKWWGLQHE